MRKSIYDPGYDRLISLLKQRRLELGLRQEDVAQRIGVDRSVVGKIELRERRLDVVELYRLCEIYQIPWAALESLLEERPP